MSSKVKYLSSILTPVSLGELIDKITILEIKQIYMTGIKLKNVDKELKLLSKISQDENLEKEFIQLPDQFTKKLIRELL